MRGWKSEELTALQDEVGDVPTICFDYCFLIDDPGGESVLVRVGREKRSKMMLAHVVPFKCGGVDRLVGHLLRDLRKMDVHGKVILKSDQENATLDVLNDDRKQRGEESDSAVTFVSQVQRENLSRMVLPNEQCKILKKEFAHTH